MNQFRLDLTFILKVSLSASVLVAFSARASKCLMAAEPPGSNKAPSIPATIYGLVQDENAKPVARARIWLLHGVRWAQLNMHMRAFDADEQGRFTITVNEPGGMTLVANANSYSFAGRDVYLAEGQPAQRVILKLSAPEELRLRVLNEASEPVQNVELDYLAWKTAGADPFIFSLELLSALGIAKPVSDKDGIIFLKRIPKGAICEGRIKHPDFARQKFEGVKAGKKPVELKLTPGHALTVIAINGNTKKPVQGANIRVWAKECGSLFENSDNEGRATIRLADARDVDITVAHPQLMSPSRPRIPRWGALSDSVLEMELFPKVKVTGRCVDIGTGKPVAGIEVGLISRGANSFNFLGFTDADGRYEMMTPEGPVMVEALTGPGRRDRWKIEGETTKATEMPDLKLKQLPMVRGRVNGTDGKPVAGAIIMKIPFPREQSILSGKDGRFEFRMEEDEFGTTIAVLHPTQRASGGQHISLEDLEAGKEMLIGLKAESEIRGTVVDSDGLPREAVPVWLEGKTKQGDGFSFGVQGSTITDAKGRYRFVELMKEPKEYRVCLAQSWQDKAPRSKWIAPTGDSIVIDPLVATEKILKAKPTASLPIPVTELRCRQWLDSWPQEIKSLRGKVVLLAFGATWSKGWAEQLAEIQLAHKLYADKGLVVIGVLHHGERIEEAEKFIKKAGLTFPIGIDNADGETFERFQVNYYPKCMLIGRDGKRVEDRWQDGNFLAAIRKAVLYGDQDTEVNGQR